MAFSNHLPISETLGTFVGVAGFDWLTEGNAEPEKALIAALVVGIAVAGLRHLRHAKNRH
ncbi:MAG: hypothetical protein L6Q40_11110 [Azonexus sp.]|nr:hypothetical protein [Azonexus sp.]